jgi:uncharacterized protein DUF6090
MIKFFRKIRQKLLSGNKFSKYLIYAIGEIFLVVIGILIALQINNWNDERKTKKEENLALMNLTKDFEFNLTSIKDLITTTSNEIDLGLIILANTGIRYKNSRNFEFNSMLSRIASLNIYSSQNGFLNDLINSGKIGIIENDSLRVSLSSWGPTIEELYRKEQTALHHTTLLIDFVKKNGSWLNVDNLYPQWGITYPKSGFEIDNNALLEQLEFENLVDEVINRKGGLRERQKKVQKLNIEILRMIHAELERE